MHVCDMQWLLPCSEIIAQPIQPLWNDCVWSDYDFCTKLDAFHINEQAHQKQSLRLFSSHFAALAQVVCVSVWQWSQRLRLRYNSLLFAHLQMRVCCRAGANWQTWEC